MNSTKLDSTFIEDYQKGLKEILDAIGINHTPPPANHMNTPANHMNTKLILVFTENQVMLDVTVCCENEATARVYEKLPWRLKLFQNGELFLSFEGQGDFKVDPDAVKISLDEKWSSRSTLDPSVPKDLELIMGALKDHELGITNPLNMSSEDFKVVSWTLKELASYLKVKESLVISEYIAFQII